LKREGDVARGWESKAVEAQVEEKGLRETGAGEARELTPEERQRRARVESLKLSRARTLEQLERAASPAHRQMLKRTLLALEQQIDELG
jgi:hypothetical protein